MVIIRYYDGKNAGIRQGMMVKSRQCDSEHAIPYRTIIIVLFSCFHHCTTVLSSSIVLSRLNHRSFVISRYYHRTIEYRVHRRLPYRYPVRDGPLKLFTTQSRLLTTLKKRAFEKYVGKGENAGNQHFLLFPHCFLLYHREKSSF